MQHSEIPYEIFTIDGLYTDEQIEEWYSYVDLSPRDRPFTNAGFKNGKIVMTQVSSVMWDAIQEHLPPTYIDRKSKNWQLTRASKYVMYAKVASRERFPIHTDTGAELSCKEESKFTVLTYLNDNFAGGNTVFYDNNYNKNVEVIPKRGRTLVFDIDLFHAGMEVALGQKLWIGTELVAHGLCAPAL